MNIPDYDYMVAHRYLRAIAECDTEMEVRRWSDRPQIRETMARWKKSRKDLAKMVEDAMAVRLPETEK